MVDPWLQDKGCGFSAKTIIPEMAGIKNPMIELPMQPQKILQGVDYCIVTHIHPDHFTKDYLPADIKIIVPTVEEKKIIMGMGFRNVIVFEDMRLKLRDVRITKTPGIHGDNREIAELMGEVNGYIFEGERKKLYLAGDTIYYKTIEDILHSIHPEVIILNCCEATVPKGRLIMNLSDVEKVCKNCPYSTVIATHLDSVNHALLSSEDIRDFAYAKGLKQIVVPHNGETVVS